MADASDRVISYALTGFPETGIGEHAGWHGHFAAAPPASILTYALLDNGHTARPLGRSQLPP